MVTFRLLTAEKPGSVQPFPYGILVDKVALDRVSLRVLRYLAVMSFHHYAMHIHLSITALYNVSNGQNL
jgi:hypothetical protein